MISDTVDRRAASWVRGALYTAIPVAAAVIAYAATRSTSNAAPAPATHVHSSVTPADTARAVMLTSADAHRIGVTYAAASLQDMSREIRTVGQIIVDETRVKVATARVDGWIERAYVNYVGQEVTAGAPLGAINSPMLATAQEELLLAKKLQSDVSNGSPDARAQAATLLASARSRLAFWDVSPDEIARLEADGKVQQPFVLRSKVSGFVIDKTAMTGQRVMAGDVLYKIADLSRVWLEGEVYEQDFASLRVGQRVEAELQALSNDVVVGRVAYIYPSLNPETRTARVRVELSNENRRLKPGLFATLRLSGAASPPVLTIPRASVLSTGERNLVFVKRADGMLEPRAVQIGLVSSDRIQVTRGLALGDTVVASATFLIDAESNLGTAFGGMGNMPGMDIAAPKKKE